ncbi:sensor histidine kinase [Ruminiclostridium herbifermentans]|uniref:Sensor histidine kinase n=1 Tax=Ruminiclostridium herbifermentans TaxID=2488810 RepID=A0A4U7JLM2_9FIRM|nr:sensor histidine kinase [Ruminiclostridium herbifermentans]QNU68197.1 sensor histidine kinase [Ruminiclostridium herbifermentans]
MGKIHFNHITKLFKEISIKNKIFIFYIVILGISLSIFTLLTISISNKAIIEKAQKNAGRELTLIDKSLMNLTRNCEDYARILSTENRLQNQLELVRNNDLNSIQNIDVEKTLKEVISNIVQPNTKMSAASIMSSKNILFDIGYADNLSVYSQFDNALIDKVVEIKSPVWTSLFKLKYRYGEEENVFAIAKSIIGKNTGARLGIAILYLKETEVASIYLNNIINENDKFFILDSENNIISTQDKDDLYQKFDEEKYLGKYKLDNIQNDESLIVNIDGIQTLVTLHKFDKLNWKIISTIPMNEITSENKGITRLIIIIGVACLVFAFIASYLLSYTISKPILNLVRIMKEIKQGNLGLRADFNANDEIGMLGDGFNSLMDRINKLLEQIYNEQRIKRENEFRLLQSQIKPHFLYNTIETIISFIKLDLKENAIMSAKYLAGFYRISLSKGNDIITIEDEMLLIKNYLSIQKLRYIEYMDYELYFDEEILKYQIPKLTLQPLVENSIYHGLKQKEDKGTLIIKGYKNEECVFIEVFDNGIGISPDKIDSILHSSAVQNKLTDFGVSSVDTRLKLLYGEEYGLKIESIVGEYTKVTVKLPATKL